MAAAATDTENLLVSQPEGQQQRRSGMGRKVVFTAALAGAVLLVGLVFHAVASPPQQANTQGGFVDLASKAPVAKISAEEGHKIAKEVLMGFSEFMGTGDASKILAITADELAYEFSGNNPPAGKKKKGEIYGGKGTLFGDSWSMFCSSWMPTNIFSVVDTGLGKVWITFEVVALFDAHGKVKPSSKSFVKLTGNLMEVTLDDDKKVAAMKAWWNPTDPDLGAALAAIMPKPDKAPPAPEVVITEEEGIDLIDNFLSETTKCFDAGDFTKCTEMFAEETAWDWSGDVKGKGSKADWLKVISGSWGALVSKFHPTKRGYVVDSVAGVAAFTFDIALVMDGHGKVKDTEDAMFFGTNVFELTFNKDKKITLFKGHWDSTDPALLKKVGTAMAALKA